MPGPVHKGLSHFSALSLVVKYVTNDWTIPLKVLSDTLKMTGWFVCVVQRKQPSFCPSTFSPEKELFSDALLCSGVYSNIMSPSHVLDNGQIFLLTLKTVYAQ